MTQISLLLTFLFLMTIPQAASQQNIHPDILAFCQRVFVRNAKFPNSSKNIYVNYCNAFLYPERFKPENAGSTPALPVKVEPDKGNICAVFGNSNSVSSNQRILCSLVGSDPTRPKHNHYQGDKKNQLVLDMFARSFASRTVPSYLHPIYIERWRIAAQHQEKALQAPGNPGGSHQQGNSSCWIVQGDRFVRRGGAGVQVPTNFSQGASKQAIDCLGRGGVLDAIWD